MKRLTVAAISFALAGSAGTALSAPRVSGNTITWPDDGWYQVLDAHDYQEICGGGASCDVSAGRYIVINHTTGQRFENVVVRDRSGTPMPVTVSGSTLSWPDDGWYQVQRADDYTTVCEGVRQCDVEDGVYTVINHTAGIRYPGILVDSSDTGNEPDGPMEPETPIDPGTPENPDTNGISIVGNTITWPDNGWYQVQSLDNFESICEGGTSCTVPDGVYVVINHTTGERFEPYLVPSETGTPNNPNDPTDPMPGNEIPAGEIPIPVNARLDEATPYLLETLAGYQLEQAQSYIASLGVVISATALSETTLESGSVQITVFDEPRDLPQERTEYGCPGGGTMLREVAVSDIDFSDYSQDDRFDTWRFVDCLVDANASGLFTGEHVLNGQVTKVDQFISGRRFTNYKQDVVYTEFSLDAPGDNSLSIDGSASVNVFDTFDPRAARNVVIDSYSETRNGELLRDVRDADFQYLAGTSGSGAIQNRAFAANGRILGTVTQGMDVTISTIETFERSGVVNEDFANNRVPFMGQMQLSSTDGAEMSVTARSDAPEFDAPLLYDYTLLTADGETVAGSAEAFPSFAINAPSLDLLPE